MRIFVIGTDRESGRCLAWLADNPHVFAESFNSPQHAVGALLSRTDIKRYWEGGPPKIIDMDEIKSQLETKPKS